jgi:N-methylhydantoinase A/oxoprolinase/acetone carboxylase beta subunit
MVEAVDVRTSGLGGDSEVALDRRCELQVGPRKAMPLSLMALRFPATLGLLEARAALERLPEQPTNFAFRHPRRSTTSVLPALEQRIWESLTAEPRPVSEVVRNASGLDALRRLADAGLATLAAFTPSDAMHVLGLQSNWSAQAAEYGARILATVERNARAARHAVPAAQICERTVEQVVRKSARLLLDAALAQDPGLEALNGRWGPLGDAWVEATVAGRRLSNLLGTALSLARPLVAIGAPVGAYYPEVARRLGALLTIPPHAEVCNAVGAVAGVISQTVDISVDQPSFQVFRVHDPAGSRDYAAPEAAIEHACEASRQLALAAARRAGAADPQVETQVTTRMAQMGPGADYLAEAVARSVATGRPLVGHATAPSTHPL